MRKIIIKYRERTEKIAAYEALLKRLPVGHEKTGTVLEMLNYERAGAGGEERVDELLSFFEPNYPFVVIQDLSLPDRSQIDTIIITQDRLLILEIKNMGGKLRLQTNPSVLHQTYQNGNQRYFKSPVVQAETAKIKMEKILGKIGYILPVQTAVIMAYPSQVIENVPPDATVWIADELFFQLHRMEIGNQLLTEEQLYALGAQLLTMDQKYQPFPLAPNLRINPRDIQPGVYCPRCRLRKMNRIVRKWECAPCNLFSKDAHLEAIDEWFMLIKPTITTNECKIFLGVQTIDTAKHALRRNNLEEVGGRRQRFYRQKQEQR
ncbi:Nuclease-related domain-containing protein [Planococcus glaciei]|uniref:nuclease-related domain-containing protein n=1 Tax=Planococcus glaciei TaxID=459472 RepID=UPI00088C04A7|nr:nuclease-related domain-containing protein [Planococcus glaciei]SDH88819.1 Nuclease-related domain-containing protein [Planococcus glaciei]